MSYDIVIIGGGAGGVSQLAQLVNGFIEKKQTNVSICVVEKGSEVGGGLPYNTSEKDHILNLSADTMSAIPDKKNDFIEWAGNNKTKLTSPFPPRILFGKYLKDLAESSKALAKRHGMNVEFLCNIEVIKLQKHNKEYLIELSNGTCLLAKQVILAVGHLPSSQYTQFISQKRYYHSPWLKEKPITEIPRDKTVCFLGSRLTAIDAALTLVAHGHTGKLIMVSRSGLLPCVIGRSRPYEKKFLTLEKINELTLNGVRSLKLETLLELFLHEIHNAEGRQLDVKKLLKINKSPHDWLKYEINAAEKEMRPWQSVLISLYPIVPYIWRALSEEDKVRFMGQFYSLWMTYVVAFPLENAKKIMGLLESGQLEVFQELEKVVFNDKSQQYVIQCKATEIAVDYLVNATGPGCDIKMSNAPLLEHLLEQKMISIEPHGGIKVNFKTLQAKGDNLNNLYAIGEITKGTFLVTTDLGVLSRQASCVAHCIVDNALQQRNTQLFLDRNTLVLKNMLSTASDEKDSNESTKNSSVYSPRIKFSKEADVALAGKGIPILSRL